MTSLGDVARGRAPGGIRRYRGELSPATLVAATLRAGGRAAVIDCSAARSRDDLIAAFAEALRWPAWVGRNWDAFEEAVGDSAVSDRRPLLLVLLGSDEYARRDDAGWRTVLSILRSTIQDAPALQVVLWEPSGPT